MEREIIFRNASQYIESLGKQFRAVAPLSRQHLIKTPDPSCQHQGIAGEAEPVGFGGAGREEGENRSESGEGYFRFPFPQGEEG